MLYEKMNDQLLHDFVDPLNLSSLEKHHQIQQIYEFYTSEIKNLQPISVVKCAMHLMLVKPRGSF